MIDRLLPRTIDNRFPGHWAGPVLFGLMLLLKFGIAIRSIASPRAVAEGADGIPLHGFAPDAVREIVSIFGLLGLLHLTMATLGLIVLLRYRAMVPLIFALLLAERGGRALLLWAEPGAPRNPGAPGAIVAWVLLAMMLTGFALSFWPGKAGSNAA